MTKLSVPTSFSDRPEPSFVDTVRAQLRTVANPNLAPSMQRYMKSEMPYLGVPMPLVRQQCRLIFKNTIFVDGVEWEAMIANLWANAGYREERYVATELSSARYSKQYLHIQALPLFERMIVSGGWWDHVDSIATNHLWQLLRNDRDSMRQAMLRWAHSDNVWKRRSSIICQLKAAAGTDLDLLYSCIQPSMEWSDFFVRKAIGWALRQYARTDPNEVRRYVAANASSLSKLSQREALKYLKPGP